MNTKLCKRCGQTKPAEKFSRCSSRKDGLGSYCRECDNRGRKERTLKIREKYAQIGFEKVKSKICSKCQQEKTADNFYRDGKRKDGLRSFCKSCYVEETNASARKYKEKNKLKNKNFDYSKEIMLRCCHCKEIKSSRLFSKSRTHKSGYSQMCKACGLAYHRQEVYGITPNVLCALIKQQNGKCGICGKDFGANFHVDHSHITNSVRGLLCRKCNTGLGMFFDDVGILHNAISYLVNFSKNEVSRAS